VNQPCRGSASRHAPLPLNTLMKWFLLIILAALLIFLANQLWQTFFLGR
jgi:hypothetical protein